MVSVSHVPTSLPRFPQESWIKTGLTVPSPRAPAKRGGASGLQNMFIEGKREAQGWGGRGDPGGRWVRTTPHDKVCCSSSPCTDRKGPVTPDTHSTNTPRSLSLPPSRHASSARPELTPPSKLPQLQKLTTVAPEASSTPWLPAVLGTPTHSPAPCLLPGRHSKNAPQGPLNHN